MGKFIAKRNFGYGKQIEWAGKQALVASYGGGHRGTVATHVQQWNVFCGWAAVQGVRDARDIRQSLIEEYATTLHEQVTEELIGVDYAQNLLSGLNTTLEALRGDLAIRIASPSEWVGRRAFVRLDQPTGYEWQTVDDVIVRLQELGLKRAAIVVRFARCFGVRLREAVLADIATWQKQAKRHGAIDIRKGTKGGRGKEVERWIAVSEKGTLALLEATQVRDLLGCEKNLLQPGESYKSLVNDRELNLARRHLHQCGIKGYHDLRAAWACERYEQLSGYRAPVIQPVITINSTTDREVREILTRELGHDRISVVAEYIGARP